MGVFTIFGLFILSYSILFCSSFGQRIEEKLGDILFPCIIQNIPVKDSINYNV